jgi:ATP-dependent Clp protease ATP-binding subunit ClpC
MDSQKSDDEPQVQPEASRGGSGRGRTAVGAGTGGDSGPGNIMQLAQEEARRLGHNFVGTEQILVALIRCRSGIAPKVLSELGLEVEEVREQVESIIGRGSGFVAREIPFTSMAKRVLQLSWEEARQLGHNYIGSEHVLLGIVREGEGVAVRVLEKLGIERALVRERVEQHLARK